MDSYVIGGSQSTATGTPERGPFTTAVKDCCGVLTGDVCDCVAFAAEARGVFARPIFWDLRTKRDVA